MSRTLAAVLLILTLGGVACRGGDKQPAAAPTGATAIASATPRLIPTVTAAASPTEAASAAGSDSTSAFGSLFSTVFGSALSGQSGAGAGAGAQRDVDPTLTRYLLTADDLPAGFTPFGQFTFRVPDGISKKGGMDMAMSMAMGGDIRTGDPSKASMLMSMVLKPDDLTALGEALSSFGQLSDESLKQSIGDAGALGGIKIKDAHVLDASGLGEGGAGISMTMDLGDYLSKLGGVAGASKVSVITIHMYMFGRGKYVGALMRMGFSDSLPAGVDELALARIVDGKLKSAP